MPPAPGPPPLARLIAPLAALAAGFVAWRLQVPLGWVLGPMFATAAASIAGLPVIAPVAGRRGGQMIIGASLGLHVTAQVAAELAGWLPAIVGAIVAVVMISVTLAAVLARLARVNGQTAYFGMLPGGLAELAGQGAEKGGDAEVITLCQALRIMLVVSITPPLVLALGTEGSIIDPTATARLGLPEALLVAAAALAGVALLRLIRFAAAWMVGSVFAVGLVAALGLADGAMPPAVFYLGQFFIGLNIGARFRREAVLRLPRLALLLAGFQLVQIATLAGVAAALAAAGSLDTASAVLALSPGGLAEMSTTAQVLHLDAVLITGFHVVRAVVVNAGAMPLWRLLARVGPFRGG